MRNVAGISMILYLDGGEKSMLICEDMERTDRRTVKVATSRIEESNQVKEILTSEEKMLSVHHP
jgi:hypothetical protein